MRALIIQHDSVSPPGPIGERLAERGYEVVTAQVVDEEHAADPDVVPSFPEIQDFDLVVAMGSIYSVYDVERIGSWLIPELQLLREADASGVPVLGICFGGQVLAQAHGGSVGRSPHPEIGWTRIDSDDPGLVGTGPWFQWHYDRWTLPPGAQEIARNAAASQAFVLRRNLAVQFHPELTSSMLAGWYSTGGHDSARDFGLDPDQVLADTVVADPEARLRAYALVDAFLDRVAADPAP